MKMHKEVTCPSDAPQRSGVMCACRNEEVREGQGERAEGMQQLVKQMKITWEAKQKAEAKGKKR